MTASLKATACLVVLGLLAGFGVLSCQPDSESRNPRPEAALRPEEKQAWDATAVFLTGIFTIANADSLDSTVFFENFRANYEWIRDVFLPHLRGSPSHAWWECDAYCVAMAKKLAKGDRQREKELRETLSRYRIHERKRTKSPGDGPPARSESGKPVGEM